MLEEWCYFCPFKGKRNAMKFFQASEEVFNGAIVDRKIKRLVFHKCTRVSRVPSPKVLSLSRDFDMDARDAQRNYVTIAISLFMYISHTPLL